MQKAFYNETKKLLAFIQQSPTAFQACENAASILKQHNYTELEPTKLPKLTSGNYYISRNGTALIAFSIPEGKIEGFRIAAAHSDSPSFKIKHNAENETCSAYTRLNVEPYGGMIMSSWMDRPLSIAGRVVVEENGKLQSRSIAFDEDLVIIPNVCIHFNRQINDGYKFNPAVDLQPLYGAKGTEKLLDKIADKLKVSKESILGTDLYLCNRAPGFFFGGEEELFSSPRIDNLQCAYGTLQGFLSAKSSNHINVWCVFDNEETGSQSKQGACSDFLPLLLDRILADNQLDKAALLASSFLVSADNGHAIHPNHPELSDPQNAPVPNGGVVVKYNAAQHYATDGYSDAYFRLICKKAGVPVQAFANRSDLRGGSTLGSLLNCSVSIPTVDIGLAQLAMHSAYETGGTKDTKYLIDAMKAYYEAT